MAAFGTSGAFRDLFNRDFGLIFVSALIFTVSFLWKDLINDVQSYYFPTRHGFLIRTVFVMVVTVAILLVVVWFRNYMGLDHDYRFGDDDPMGDDVGADG